MILCRVLFALVFASFLAVAEPSIDELVRGFKNPPADARVMMRWWWFGPSVTKPEIERELRMMKAGGMGGVEIQPVYPLEVNGNFPFLSGEFLDAVRFTNEKGRELGLRVDLTLGSGWPFGGPHIPIIQAAGRLRCDRVKVAAGNREVAAPRIGDGEKLIAAFLDGREIEVANGVARIPAGASGAVQFFTASRTKMKVKRASVGAEGYVLDHYNLAAVDNHLKTVGEPLLKAFGSNPPYAIFSDSLEVFASDWTDDLLAEFQKRRGYDLKPYLPALVDNMGEKTGAVRNDWALTLTELCEERYLKPLTAWAHAHGTKFRSQTYGTPPVTLSSQQFVDLAEGEQPHWRKFTPSRWASSANHLFGRTVTSTETWTWLHSPVFRATPLDMKAEADLHFLEGVNQLIGHGWPYSPEIAGEPGWRFYASAVFNNHNPWWIVMPEVTGYIQRVSYLMRQGKPANDVALYLPTADARAQFTIGKVSVDRAMDRQLGPTVIPQILDSGYNFDFIDDGAIEKLANYPVLVLPGVERIPLEAFRKIAAYAKKGGKVIALRRTPSTAPGLTGAEDQSRQIHEISAALFSGRTVADEQLGEALRAVLAPDMALSAPAPEIGFIHRKTDSAHIYFIANTSNQPRCATARFRVEGMQAESWNAFTGEIKPVRGAIDLNLAPYESRVIVFSKRSLPVEKPVVVGAAKSIDLSAGWKVTFSNRTTAMERLHSWADDEATKFYSGEAAYEKTVSVPAAFLHSAVSLDFGQPVPVTPLKGDRPGMRACLEAPVREAAVVYVNGKRAGSVWRPPYAVDVTGLLRSGDNAVRVVVANTALNRLAGAPLPDYKELEAKYGSRFQPQDMGEVKPLPSGLLGPVRLIAR